MDHAISWFEIFVTDLARAKKFYETVLDLSLQETQMDGQPMAFFPFKQNGGVGGNLRVSKDHRLRPSSEGALIYFNVNPDLSQALGRIEDAGGHIDMPKTSLGKDAGYMAIARDTEGNRFALHSQQ